jgi:hypothetical protein
MFNLLESRSAAMCFTVRIEDESKGEGHGSD